VGYKSLSGVTKFSFLNLKSHHFLLLCCVCFTSFYASLCVHKGFGCAWTPMCTGE
jgi:hypothetical protein